MELTWQVSVFVLTLLTVADGTALAVLETATEPVTVNGTFCTETDYTVWSTWSSCSVTCGDGSQFRTRYCNDVISSGIHKCKQQACGDTPGSPKDFECSKEIDVSFLIDSSGSVGLENFKKIQNFTKEVTTELKSGYDRLNLTVITFNNEAKIRLSMNETSDLEELLNAEEKLIYTHGGTETHKALELLYQSVLHNDTTSPKVAIVITDGASFQPDLTKTAAQQVKDSGVVIFAVGIGDDFNPYELSAISSNPDEKYFFRLNNFDELSSLIGVFNHQRCQETTTTTAASTTTMTALPTTTITLPPDVTSEHSTNGTKAPMPVSALTPTARPVTVSTNIPTPRPSLATDTTTGTKAPPTNEPDLSEPITTITQQPLIQTETLTKLDTSTTSSSPQTSTTQKQTMTSTRSSTRRLTTKSTRLPSQTTTRQPETSTKGEIVTEEQTTASQLSTTVNDRRSTSVPITMPTKVSTEATSTARKTVPTSRPTSTATNLPATETEKTITKANIPTTNIERDISTTKLLKTNTTAETTSILIETTSTEAKPPTTTITNPTSATSATVSQIPNSLTTATLKLTNTSTSLPTTASATTNVLRETTTVTDITTTQEQQRTTSSGITSTPPKVTMKIQTPTTTTNLPTSESLTTSNPGMVTKGVSTNLPPTTATTKISTSMTTISASTLPQSSSIKLATNKENNATSAVTTSLPSTTISNESSTTTTVRPATVKVETPSTYQPTTSTIKSATSNAINATEAITSPLPSTTITDMLTATTEKDKPTTHYDPEVSTVSTTKPETTTTNLLKPSTFKITQSTISRTTASTKKSDFISSETTITMPPTTITADFSPQETSSTEPPTTTTASCIAKIADVVFVVDTSGSIGRPNFERIKQFIKDVILTFDVDYRYTRVGLIEFSTTPKIEFKLHEKTNITDLLDAVDNITYSGGGTSTSDALELMRIEGFDRERPLAPDIAVVITDGLSKFPQLTRVQAQLAKAEGIAMFSIGIGNATSSAELKAIASNPSYVFEVGDYQTLFTLDGVVAHRACGVILPEEYHTRSSTPSTTTRKGCFDIDAQCPAYPRDSCSDYEPWARKNCPRKCGFCPGFPLVEPPCEDTIGDCDTYGTDMCSSTSQYEWVDAHCRKFCGFCGNKTDSITTTTTPATTVSTASTCSDLLPNCTKYGGPSMCQTFGAWARAHCAKYCEFCYNYTTVPSILVNSIRCPNWKLPDVCTIEQTDGHCCPMPKCPARLILSVQRH